MANKIPEAGIVAGQTIQPEQLLNVTNALRGETGYDIFMSGSVQVTGSFSVQGTGSFDFIDLTGTTINSASHADYADVAGTAIIVTSASHAIISDSSLVANTVTSASHALRSDVAISVEGSITSASFADYAMSSSHALLADNVDGSIVSASFADYAMSSSAALWSNQSALADLASSVISASHALQSDNALVSLAAGTSISSSHAVTADVADSYAGSVTSASFSDTSLSASHADFATSASVEVTHEVSSSFSDTSLSSSFALYSNESGNAETSTSSSFASFANDAGNSDTADSSTSASFAESIQMNNNLSFELKNYEGSLLNYMTYEYTSSDYIQKISYFDSSGGTLFYEQQFTYSLDLMISESIVRQSDGFTQTMAYGYSASVVTSKEIVQ